MDNRGSRDHWVATWRAAPQQPMSSGTSQAGLDDQTVRMVIHTTVGGDELRLRFSNAYGTQPVTIAKVDVALHKFSSSVVPGTDHLVTFGGQDSVTIPVGEEVVSDPVPMRVGEEQDLVISAFFHRAPARPPGISRPSRRVTFPSPVTGPPNRVARRTRPRYRPGFIWTAST